MNRKATLLCFALSLLAIPACGDDDTRGPDDANDAGPGSGGRSGATGGAASSTGGKEAGAGGSGTGGRAENTGGAADVDSGPTCTNLSDFVTDAIQNDTLETNRPVEVTELTLCEDPEDPAAYDGLFR
jgi:hypothetical protein